MHRSRHLWVMVLAAGLATAEEPAPPPPKTILTYAERLGLSTEQRTRIQGVLDDHAKALQPLDEESAELAGAVDQLIAAESDLAEIKDKLDEEATLRARWRGLVEMAAREAPHSGRGTGRAD